MKNWEKYIIRDTTTIRQALTVINELGDNNSVLFVTDAEGVLKGTITDGDIRRGLIANAQLEQDIITIANKRFHKIENGGIDPAYINKCKEAGVKSLPSIDNAGKILSVINLTDLRTVLPLHAIIMAGGRGERLLPLTKNTPKPMLKVGDKPIIEHNIDRLINFGVENFYISIRYLGEQIENYFHDGNDKNVHISYIKEKEPLGTIGALSLIKEIVYDHVLVMNADLLTNLDYEDMFATMLE